MTGGGISADLDSLVAVVTGGTTGIGRAIAETLADNGASVVPTSRTKSSVEDAADAVDCDLVCPTDITSRSDVRTLFERTTDVVGEINVLVNCAGVIHQSTPVDEITDEEWNTTLDTNLYGVFLTSQLVPKYMDTDHRTILNVSSVNSEIPLKGLAAYVSSKFGVKGLTETLALEYATEDIGVNALAPGYVVTRQNEEALNDPTVRDSIHRRTPFSRYARRDEVAAAALFMVSPAATFITGETLVVDGGFALK